MLRRVNLLTTTTTTAVAAASSSSLSSIISPTAASYSSSRFASRRSGIRAHLADRYKRRQVRDKMELDQVAKLFLEGRHKDRGDKYAKGLRAAAVRRLAQLKKDVVTSTTTGDDIDGGATAEQQQEAEDAMRFSLEDDADDGGVGAADASPAPLLHQEVVSLMGVPLSKKIGVTDEEDLRSRTEAAQEVAAAAAGSRINNEERTEWASTGRQRKTESTLQQMRDRVGQGIGSDAARTKTRTVPIVAAVDRIRSQSRKRRLPLQRQLQLQKQQELEVASAYESQQQQQQQPSSDLVPVPDEQQWPSSSTGGDALSEKSSSMINHFSTSSNIINDIGADKLDQIELARSGALAKRVHGRLPLPVYQTDEQLIRDFFPGGDGSGDEPLNHAAALDNNSPHHHVDVKAAAAAAIGKLRGHQLEQMARSMLEKRNAPVEVDEAMLFRRNANKAKDELAGTEEVKHVATEWRGDETREMAALKAEAEKLESSQQQQQQQQQEEGRESKSSKKSSSPLPERTISDLLDEKTEIRLRVPDRERIALQHSPTDRFATDLSATAHVVPSRRFAASELEERGEAVKRRHELAAIDEELHLDEKQTMSPLDAHVDVPFEKRLRQMLMKYYIKYPVNSMIPFATVIIAGVQTEDGTMHRFDNDERPRMSLSSARQIAAEHGKDLVQVLVLTDGKGVARPGRPSKVGGGGGDSILEVNNLGRVSVCYIMDHLGHAMENIQEELYYNPVTPAPLRPLLEVGFRGVAHDFAIRFKSVSVAKFIYKRFPVRVTLTKFGTAREGFPIFERVMAFVRMECERLGAFYVAGQVRYDSGSIWCYLHPTTAKMPLSQIDSPSTAQLKATMEKAMFDAEYDREVAIPEAFPKKYQREANRYNKMLDDGSAWAFRAEGLSLQAQRRLKLRQAWIPKGNKELYALRGDVDVKSPFRSQSATSTDDWMNPRDSNLEQAERGAGVLARRARLSVSEMLDQNETPSQTSLLGRMNFQITGDQIQAGNFKEAFGLKRNRKRQPRMAAGFATQGVKEADGVADGVYRD